MPTGKTKKAAGKTAQTAQTAEVATKAQFSRNDIPGMLEKINEQIANLKGTGERTSSTAGKSFNGFGRLEDINDVHTLIMMLATVESRIEKYGGIVKKLKLSKAPSAQEAGISLTTWATDITDRIAAVTHKDEIERLEKAKALLEQNLSQEQKLANDLAKLADLFQD